MKISASIKPLAMTFVLVLIAGCASLSKPAFVDGNSINQLAIQNLHHPEKRVYASGQPTQAELRVLAQAGIKHVVNLRPAKEQTWSEAAFVQTLGMKYHALPVAGAAGITDENAAALAKVLHEIGGEPVLVHCSSGNRVGALIALGEQAKGANVDEAIAKGKRWGLTRLEPMVRDLLARP